MTSKQKNSKEIWLVIDARTANSGIASGISRFVTGITCALCSELNEKRKNRESPFQKLKILIISKSDPCPWIINLVYKYPDIVSYWKGDANGFLGMKIDKPTWLWPTRTLRKIQNMTGNRVIWFAPANFDRPLFISNKTMASRVIQVVHDGIPFLKLKGIGFLFKRQFKFLVSRSLAKLPYVATVSQHSAQMLSSLVKKRINPLYLVTDAVDQEFGNKQKTFQKEVLIKERSKFLRDLHFDFDLEAVPSGNWVIGVGRNQKYKCWDIALQAIDKLNKADNKKKIWFIRVGADNKEVYNYSKKSSVKDCGKIKVLEELNLIILPHVTDAQLAQLYSISDLLVHPSLAEGFGLPPLEAALCGLPVVYRKGTAIDEHFAEESLPFNFWNGINSQYSAVWANQIERILLDKKESEFYQGLIESAQPREYILNYSKTQKNFKWEDSANALLKLIGSENGIMENI